MVVIEIVSGKHIETFSLPRAALNANRLATEIRERLAVPEGADVPPVTYEDDEGDTINLHLGVAVEFEEALRVMQLGGKERLRFTLVKALAQRQRPVVVEEAVDIAVPPALPAAAVNTADVVDQIQSIIEAHAAGVNRQVARLENEVQMQKAAAASEAQVAAAAQRRAADLELCLVAKNKAVDVAERRVTVLEQRVSALESDAADLGEAHEALGHKHAQVKREAAAAADRYAEEKKGLVDTIAEQREQLTTKQLEVDDAKAENAALRAQLEAVYGKIAGLLPDMPKPKSKVEKVLQKVAAAADTVEAVCTAGLAEVSEAVRGTNNYACARSSPRIVEEDQEQVAAVPKRGGGGAAAVAAAASAHPSAFVQAMDAQLDDAMEELEDEFGQPTKAQRDAFHRIRNMGFQLNQGHVSQLMNKHNNDIAAVLSEILG